MLRSATLGVVLLVAAIPTTSTADEHHQLLAPDRIQEIIQHDLADNGIDGVTVEVHGDDVTLKGLVDSAWQKRKAQKLALETTDVVSVANRLDIARAESDDEIAADIAKKVRRYVFYTIYDTVEFKVQDGRVTLDGWVTQPYKAEEIANMASKTFGVQAVRNDIQALPVSTYDIELRQRIARRIYNDPLFSNSAYWPEPPIHVIVRDGNVTLEGVVASELEKQKAGLIARTVFGSFEVNNDLRIG